MTPAGSRPETRNRKRGLGKSLRDKEPLSGGNQQEDNRKQTGNRKPEGIEGRTRPQRGALRPSTRIPKRPPSTPTDRRTMGNTNTAHKATATLTRREELTPGERHALAVNQTQAASMLSVSRNTFRQRIAPYLRCVYLGRRRLYLVRDLERWLEDNATEPHCV